MEIRHQQQSDTDARRGIQNTAVRFSKNATKRLLNEQIQNKVRIKRFQEQDDNEFNVDTPKENFIRQKMAEEAQLQSIISDFNAREQLGDNSFDIDSVRNQTSRPTFPFFVVTVAVIKDILDPIATFTIIGILVTIGLMLPISLVLYFWLRGKISGGWWKKQAIKKLLLRFGLTITVESMPLVQIIPATTIFVLMAQYRETKIVKLFDALLTEIHTARIPLK